MIVANDRIWMRCRKCGEEQMLYKYFPGPTLESYASEDVQAFVEKHVDECHAVHRPGHLGGERCFDLYAESAEPTGDGKFAIIDKIEEFTRGGGTEHDSRARA